MKSVLKVLGIILAVLVLVVAIAYVHLEMTWKKNFAGHPKPSITATTDSATIARGEYLANAVAHCSACHQHTPGMASRSGLELNLEYSGGHVWDIPLFGRFVSANLTPDPETGIGKLSDGDIARVVRHGLARNGDIAPFMSIAVGPMSDEDLSAIISYLRTLKPLKQANPPEVMGLFGKLVSKKLGPADRPAPAKWVREGGISAERGEYLANGPAACFGCHSVSDPMNGFVIEGPRFQGAGTADPDPMEPGFEIIPPNLTPDPETGHITSWTEEDFLKRFQSGVVFKGSPMPWENFARMTEDDIRSLYRYLRSLPPAKHAVGPPRRPKGSWKPAKA